MFAIMCCVEEYCDRDRSASSALWHTVNINFCFNNFRLMKCTIFCILNQVNLHCGKQNFRSFLSKKWRHSIFFFQKFSLNIRQSWLFYFFFISFSYLLFILQTTTQLFNCCNPVHIHNFLNSRDKNSRFHWISVMAIDDIAEPFYLRNH
jgi:hypothetical protein